MYISRVQIRNYRCFGDLDVNFNENINVIIGHNNTGKSNLIKALSLIFDSNSKKRLEVNDFNKYIKLENLKESPPKISIAVTISQSQQEDLMSSDLATVSNWLTKLEEPYEAKLTYEYFLPIEEHSRYKKMVSKAEDSEKAWKIIKEEFIRLYTYKIWGGKLINQTPADTESLQRFDFQFLDAIRDVERDMFTGKNTLLKDVLDFFMDYDVKSEENKTEDQKIAEIKSRKQKFTKEADNLLVSLQKRMEKGEKQILSYASNIGASFDRSVPSFEGSITDVELYSALKLIVKYSDEVKIPVTHNGLGYNNLIFISLLLSKMQINIDEKYLGGNVKVFPILAIEEPEAHLHPTMQYHFLNFLINNIKQNKVRQIFITTHSTHIVASIPLDNIICLYRNDNIVSAAYPGKAFTEERSKKYVQRFLDATKSDMLFAEKVILVEGITEQLLLSIFAQYMGEEYSLEKNHVTVINVGGRYFNHFLSLFDTKYPHTIKRKVACLTDIDPSRKEKDGEGKRFESCYPFEYTADTQKYEYKQNTYLDDYIGCKHPNIRVFTQNKKYGKTFEYDLILANPSLDLLITDSIRNKEEIRELMTAYRKGKSLEKLEKILSDRKEDKRIKDSLKNAPDEWTEDDKKKALIAARYLNSVDKGENALELAYKLQENLDKKDSLNYRDFEVPQYIQDAIKWVCK